MPIEVLSNEPKVETPAAAATENKPAAQAGTETPAAEANALAETEAAASGAVENEEPTETVVETTDPDPALDPDAKDPANKDPNKKKGGFQRRIDKLSAKVTAKEQEVEFWKQQALKGAGAPKEQPKVDSAKPAAIEGKPDPKKFELHSEYVEALVEWKSEEKRKEGEQKNEQSKLISDQKQIEKVFSERFKEFSKKTEDLVEVLSDVDDIKMSAAVRDIIMSSENGPQLAYELAKNREEYARIATLPPLAAAREMGRFEAKFFQASSSEKKPEQKTTKAPPPLAPVRGGAAAPPKTLDEAANTSFADYKKAREAELKKRRQA